MKIKKTLCILLCTVLTVSCFSSCARSDKGEDDSKITVRVGIWPDSADSAAVSVWNEYEKHMADTYPDIVLEPASMSYSFEGIVSMAASGTLPTIFSVYFTEPQRLIANSFIADITDLAEEYGYLDGQYEQFLSLAAKDGRQYGIVRDAYGMALLINMKLFRKAGLVNADGTPKVPQTLDELLITAQKIKQKTGKAGFCISTKGRHGGWQFTNLAWAFGAEFERKDESGKIFSGLADEPTIEAMKYIQKMRWQLGVMPDDNQIGLDYINLFANNEAAMMFAAPDAIRNIIMCGNITKDDIAVAPIPSGKASVSLMGGTMYVFSSSATKKEIEACFKLLQLIGITPDASERMYQSLERELKSHLQAGYAIFEPCIDVWSDPERKKAEKEIYRKYTNVDLKLYKDYYQKINNMLVPECKISCQELYATIDACLYEVMTDPKCNVEDLMKTTAEAFEGFYYN